MTNELLTNSKQYSPAADRGRTTIDSNVVAQIAGLATREVEGVHDMGTRGASGAIAGIAEAVTQSPSKSKGISVQMGQEEVAIEIALVLNYGARLKQVAEQVRQRVIERIETMTGLSVREVNIDINSLHYPSQNSNQPAQEVEATASANRIRIG